MQKLMEASFVLSKKQPFFRLEDLRSADIKDESYIDPYYKVRRPIEPERLRQIYQQAFIYDLLYKFAKEHLPDIPNASIKKELEKKDNAAQSNKTTDTTIDNIKDLVIDYLFKSQVKIDEVKKVKSCEEETPDCIWNTDDLNILRRSFSLIKENNVKLRSQIVAYEEESRELREKAKLSSEEARSFKAEKLCLEQENERLYIRVQDLESRYVLFNREFQELREDKKELIDKLEQLKKMHEEMASEKMKLELELHKCESKLASIKTELKLEYSNMSDKLKTTCMAEINRYKKKLSEEAEKFQSLKSQHEKSQKALEHLRTHFMYKCVPPTTNPDKIDDKKIKII